MKLLFSLESARVMPGGKGNRRLSLMDLSLCISQGSMKTRYGDSINYGAVWEISGFLKVCFEFP